MTMVPALLAVLLLGVCSALPQFNRAPVPTLTTRTEQFDDAGQYSRSYYLNDGTAVIETGQLTPNAQNDGLVLNKKGSYQYTTPEGKFVKVEYLADQTGFHILNSEGLPVDHAVEATHSQTGFGGNQGHFVPHSKFAPTQFETFTPQGSFAPQGQLTLPSPVKK